MENSDGNNHKFAIVPTIEDILGMNQLDLKNLCKLHGAGNSGNRAVVMDRMMQILHRKTVEQCTNEGYQMTRTLPGCTPPIIWAAGNQKRDPVMDSAAHCFMRLIIHLVMLFY